MTTESGCIWFVFDEGGCPIAVSEHEVEVGRNCVVRRANITRRTTYPGPTSIEIIIEAMLERQTWT